MRSGLKMLFVAVPAFVMGILLGLYGLHPVQVPQEDVEQLRLEKTRLQSQLARIATVDFADYQRLQNEEAQFIKAKEILGKVFLILFHNLLSDVPDEQKQFAQSLASGGSPVLEASVPPPASAPEKVPASEPQVTRPVSPEVPLKAESQTSWTQAEKNLSQLNAEKSEAFLQSTVIKDIMSEQIGTRPFKSDDSRLEAMQGHYSGELIFLDPKKKPKLMEFNLSSDVKDGALVGNSVLRIVDDEGRQSRLGQDGHLTEILKPVSESKALIIRVYKTEFLQMYILENQGLIIGNYYNEGEGGKVEHLGRFKLRR